MDKQLIFMLIISTISGFRLLQFIIFENIPVLVPTQKQDLSSSFGMKRNFRNLCHNKFHSRKIFTFALYQSRSNHKYLKDLEKVLKEFKSLEEYKSWNIRVYHNLDLHQNLISWLTRLHKNISLCDVRRFNNLRQDFTIKQRKWLFDINKATSTNWRIWNILSLADDNIDATCIRNLAWHPSQNEIEAIKKWISSYTILHSFQKTEHMASVRPIRSDAWCFRNEKNRLLGKVFVQEIFQRGLETKLYYSSLNNPKYWIENELLLPFVWKRVKNDALQDVTVFKEDDEEE